MELELIKAAMEYGIGPLAIVALFLIYRCDRRFSEKALRDDRKRVEDLLTNHLKEWAEDRRANTNALGELSTVIRVLSERIGRS